MRTEHESEWRQALVYRLLRMPDGALLLLAAVWVIIACFGTMALLGSPVTWWKSLITSTLVGGPTLYIMRLSQMKRNLGSEHRDSTTDEGETSSTPPGSGA